MIDTHAHIDSEAFDSDRAEMLERAFSSGIETIMIPAIEPKGFQKLIEVAESDRRIVMAIGVHPHNANDYNQEVENRLIEISKNEKVKAIGEIGLDYYYDFAPQELQREVFARQIQFAKKQNLPLIVHNRESDVDIIKILEQEHDSNLKGVLHCFSGDEQMLVRAIELGFYVSFTGNITFKKSILAEIVRKAPIERIMLETDSPYMTPVPHRGKRNEPALISLVAEKIAEIKSMSINEVISMTNKNAKELFKLAIMAFLFLGMSLTSFAQETEDDEEEDYRDVEYTTTIDPFPRLVGLGPVFGTNTIVETYSGGQDVSYEGLAAFGGSINYRPISFIILQGTYVYSKNTKNSEKFDVDPNIHQFLEFTMQWLPNPHARVNFFIGGGLSYLMNDYGALKLLPSNVYEKYVKTDNSIGVNATLGFYANIGLPKGYGVLNFVAEWRLDFMLSDTKLDFDPRKNPETDPDYNKPTTISTFFSIPRAGFIWYPSL